MMTKEDLERGLLPLLRREPFQPFMIEFDDGDRRVIGQPEALIYHGGTTAIYFGSNRDSFMFHNEAVRRVVELVPASA